MSTNENRKILGENEELTNNKSKSQKLQKNRAQKSDSKLKNQEKSIGCNLDDDFNKIDEELILKNVNLTEEDLKLKEINNGLFWKQVAESIRRELSESLEDNQQLHEIKKSMEQENKDLNKEHLKLTKLANEAGEICSNFLNNQDEDEEDNTI